MNLLNKTNISFCFICIYLANCQPQLGEIRRRDLNLESIEDILNHDIQFLEEKSGLCTYSTKTNFLNCFGVNETFGCGAISRMNNLKNVSLELTNLKIVENNFTLDLIEKDTNFTFVIPKNKRKIVVSIKNIDDFQEPGIYIKNDDCWSNILSFIHNITQVNFKLFLFL